MQICPSILEKTTNDYFSVIKKLSSYFNYFQLDFTDGEYVDNKTADIDEFLNELTNYQEINNFYFDFHLMLKNYKDVIEKLKKLVINKKIKVNHVLIHFDLSPKNSLFSDVSIPFTIGITLNPDDKVNDLAQKYNINKIKAVQIMSVYPGFQGNSFLPKMIKKIEQLRIIGYKSKIFLDGGVNDQSISFIKSQKFLPDVICPGSYLTKSPVEEILKKIHLLNS